MLRTRNLGLLAVSWKRRLISSLRRSSVSCGKIETDDCWPSFCGLMPRSEAWIAFSMALSSEPSHGWMTSVRGSGEETVPT